MVSCRNDSCAQLPSRTMLAALGGGVMRNATGSYLMAFIASGAACLIASLLVLRIGRRPVLVAAAGE